MRNIAMLSVAALLFVGCGESPPSASTSQAPAVRTAATTPVPLTAEQQEGRGIYETVCWTCHGPAGRADGPAVKAGSMTPPPTFHTQDYANASGADLLRRFRLGLAGADPAHPHMQYVTSIIQPEKFAAALSYIPALVYPPEIPGSAINGHRIYSFRCAGCHGESGKGDGPAAGSLVAYQPADFTTDTLIAARDWDGVFGRIQEGGQKVHGSSMPPWGVVLPEADIWDLVAYLATFQEDKLSKPHWMD